MCLCVYVPAWVYVFFTQVLRSVLFRLFGRRVDVYSHCNCGELALMHTSKQLASQCVVVAVAVCAGWVDVLFQRGG